MSRMENLRSKALVSLTMTLAALTAYTGCGRDDGGTASTNTGVTIPRTGKIPPKTTNPTGVCGAEGDVCSADSDCCAGSCLLGTESSTGVCF